MLVFLAYHLAHLSYCTNKKFIKSKLLEKISKSHFLFGSSDFDDHCFMECFFEAQASITNELKRMIEGRKWTLVISDGTNPWRVLQVKYFYNKFIESKIELGGLFVRKKVLSEDDKDLIIACSSCVRAVQFHCPVFIDGWTPNCKILLVWINVRNAYVSRNDFENFYSWIRLCDRLVLYLHDETDYIEDLSRWISRSSNIKELWIRYRGKNFVDIEDLKDFKLKNRKRCRFL